MRTICAVAAAVIVIATPEAAYADAIDISGDWRGPGYAQFPNGEKEFVECRVAYDRQSPTKFALDALCATRSIRLRQKGVIQRVTATTYVGDLRNEEYNIEGRARVELKDTVQTIDISSSEGSVRLVLRKHNIFEVGAVSK